MRGAVSAGLRVLSSVCTASNSAVSTIGGTAISTTSVSGLRARFPEFGVEAVAADIRRSRQHLVHGVDAPASAVPRADAGFIEMFGDRLDAH